MTWIKCSDKLPEDMTEVLVCDKHGSTYATYYDYSKSFVRYDTSGGEELRAVTHWQPYPDLPKD